MATLGFKLASRSKAQLKLTAAALPNRNGRSPKAVARNGPVAGILEPIGKSLLTNGFWHPVDGLVMFKHPLFYFGNVHKPNRQGFVYERCIGAPAKRVAVLNGPAIKQ